MPTSIKSKTRQAFILIYRYHWLWIALASPFLIFPSPKRSLAMLVVPALWILHLWVNRQENRKPKIENWKLNIENSTDSSRRVRDYSGFPVTPLNVCLLVIAIMLLVSLWATYSVEQSLEKISGVVLGLGVYFAIVLESRKTLGWWLSLVVFLGGGLGWALLGFFGIDYQVRFNFLAPFITRIPNLISGIPGLEAGLQHNAVGGTLLWITPLVLALSVYSSKSSTNANSCSIVLPKIFQGTKARWAFRTLLWFSTLFVISVLILTQSRGTYIAFGITVIAMLSLVLPSRYRWGLLIGLVSTAVLLAFFLFQSSGWEGSISLLGLTGQAGFSLDSLASRLEIWPRAIYGVQDFPFTGMGMNTFREVVHVLYPLFTISSDIDIAHAHNEFLQAALDLGIPGLIAFISIYIISFWMLVKVWKSPSGEETGPRTSEERTAFIISEDTVLKRALVLGLGGGLFGHMIFGMTDAITLGAKPGIFFWMLLGLITGLDLGIENWKIEN